MAHPPNRYPGPCAECGVHLAAGAGELRPVQGRRRAVCRDHDDRPATPLDTVPRRAHDEPEPPPPTEVRITGTDAERLVVLDALRTTQGIHVDHRSQPHPRRDPDDPRASIYVRLQISPDLLAVAQRDLT
ncbi:hypothetical protein I5Q34_07420 [Streptomyces sp. AV19]|uniref:hypothetical protein n=1 Tax=Streptomyces sp. AV19 TaxID=2793068 RepID=UPI0018FE18B2|nr:hypothetical protein [Streptomyces sp. AV19]MBH1934125.1 hypothetical protein [Streptomyces sp. AV19]MDG4537153.1 hypothetical protein [Streptomyces sp. AV19]